MVSDLKAIYDVIERVLERRKASEEEKTRDKVLIAIYKLGNDGREAVSPEQLETEAGFSKLQIFKAIEAAESKDWIFDLSGLNDRAWSLKREALYYVEALLSDR